MLDSAGRRLADQRGTFARQKVLVVDDQPLNLAFASAELEDFCRPLQAGTGEEALQLAASEQPDLILLDVHMPGMDGFEVCRRLKRDPATVGIPIIFLTVMDEDTDEELGLNLGAIDYIGKPFCPAILRARVRNQLLCQRQRQQLERIAQIDALTGIANRRSFDRHLHTQWQRHQSFEKPLGLLLIDIDYFKEINDRCGHPAGDDTLQRIAVTIAQQMRRQEDVAARYGGEEFGYILPQTDTAGALLVGEKVRQAVLDLHIPHPASPVSPWVTVSVGASSSVSCANGFSAELVEIADQGLYRAKNKGRNQVVVL